MQGVDDREMAAVASALLGFQNAMKIHHWQTRSFAHHKASDELLASLSGLVDQFMEALQGVGGRRLNFRDHEYGVPLKNITDEEATGLVRGIRKWLLEELPQKVPLTPGLANVRDEIVTALDSTLYLFTFQ
jgi:hypothetical protein